MKKYLFKKTGNIYKADLHLHSTISDGMFTPEEIKKIYLEKGFSIVAYTDHEIMLPHPELSDENFLAINSVEFSINQDFTGKNFDYPKCYHLNFYCPEADREYISIFAEKHIFRQNTLAYVTDEMRKANYDRYYDVNCINDMIAKANSEGFLVTYNHPVWSLQTEEDYLGLKGLWGVEVYNHSSFMIGCVENAVAADNLLRQGERVILACTTDAHILKETGGAWVAVNAKSLSYDDVFTALKNKDLYSSNGPAIEEIYIEDGYLYVKTSKVKRILISAERRFCRFADDPDGGLITEGKLEIGSYIENTKKFSDDPSKAYIRITVYDEYGKVAYSRPYFYDELI
jgi:predicted metal-dependent phosphoesterase TrpH